MIPRAATATLKKLAAGYPVVAVTGPRQSGKTTLVRAAFPKRPYVSLEDMDERTFANEDPRGFLARFRGGAIIDEAQHSPALFSYIQTRVDRSRRMGEFVLTGSQNFGLLSSITQSLAGRAGMLSLLPFSAHELRQARRPLRGLDEFLLRGLYPPVHDRRLRPLTWYNNYVLTYVERDVRQIANIQDLALFQRFIRMCAARTAQLLNLSSLANDCGVSHVTIRSWLSVLQASYLVFLLPPHHASFGKRLVKTPKMYFCDTGLASALLGIEDADHMGIHPSRAALFETYVVNEYLKARFNQGLPSNLYFWRDNVGNEVDLIIERGGRLIPVEIKSGQTVADEWFAGIRKWMQLAGSPAAKPSLVFGGDRAYVRTGIAVHPWNKIP
jgi:predicted AAA+ superfamily ATPase